jgi:hypothetical protein
MFHNGKHNVYALLAHRRARRPKVYSTHVFALMVRENHDALSFESRGGKFLFLSQYGLARHLIKDHTPCVEVSFSNVDILIERTGLKVVTTSPSLKLWPDVKPARPKPQEEQCDIDLLNKLPKKPSKEKKKPRTGKRAMSHNERLASLSASVAMGLISDDGPDEGDGPDDGGDGGDGGEDDSDGSSSDSNVELAAGKPQEEEEFVEQAAAAERDRQKIDEEEANLSVPGDGRLHRRWGTWYRENARGDIFVRDHPSAIGRVTGPFGDQSGGLATGKVSWSCKCNMHPKCTMIKTGKALDGERERLIGWLLAGAHAGDRLQTQIHKGMWTQGRWAD